jgi:dihydroorotate dehydrogenase electron transfer subunit
MSTPDTENGATDSRAARAALARQRDFAAADAAALVGLLSVRPDASGSGARPESVAQARPEPVWDNATVLSHEVVGVRYRRLVLESATIARTAQAGQFLMITVPPHAGERILLPRPMAIHRRHPAEGTIEVVYGVAGRGTAALAAVAVGERLLVTGPLGRGFEFPVGARSALMIGRGVGVCALMGAVEDAAGRGIRATLLASGRNRESLIGDVDCAELGARMLPVTDTDGSAALPALAALLRREFAAAKPEVVFVCGAGVLTRLAAELGAEWGVPVQASLEAHMACGLGYCHGCAAPVLSDPAVEGPLVCVDGPVFDAALPGRASLHE